LIFLNQLKIQELLHLKSIYNTFVSNLNLMGTLFIILTLAIFAFIGYKLFQKTTIAKKQYPKPPKDGDGNDIKPIGSDEELVN